MKNKTSFQFLIPTPNKLEKFELKNSETIVFVGANGSGKSRLGDAIGLQQPIPPCRLSPNRSISIDPYIQADKLYETALKFDKNSDTNMLESFNINRNNQVKGRKTQQIENFNEKNKYSSDFEMLTWEVFSNNSVDTDKMCEVWNKILPDCQLILDKLQIGTKIINVRQNKYRTIFSNDHLSDGERGIFFIIGIVLMAKKNSLIIVDEPELHLHRSISKKLWGVLKKERADCAFIFMTHDIDFAMYQGDQKVILYRGIDLYKWELERISSEDFEFDDDLISLILGARESILFVEGKNSSKSMDPIIFRALYPNWRIVPCEGCANVISSVKVMNNRKNLHLVKCAGIIDKDERSTQSINSLKEKGIYALPVPEIENLFPFR